MIHPFHIYRSSAGSGKTRTLAREYIVLALRHPEYFKYALAVSFANKSSQEMKDRVLNYLGDFASGTSDDGLREEVQRAIGMNDAELRERSSEVLSRILHQYSQFSISTIDAFFQRVIRSFTRESGLLGNFRLESEDDRVLGEVIAALMDELGDAKPELTSWVVEFSKQRLTEGTNWNIAYALLQFSQTILRDEYKLIAGEISEVGKKIKFNDMIRLLQHEKNKFMYFLRDKAVEALRILSDNKITADDFNFKEIGTAITYFRKFASGEFAEAKPRILDSARDSGEWPNKKSPRHNLLKELAERQLRPILNEMINYVEENKIRFNSADLVESNFYEYALLTDIDRKLREYKVENNIMLLSDASHFLNGVISESDTPFIYEKVGSFYRHYLIDEFQDTSALQWKNFAPLFRDSLDQHYQNMVVGDVKQSIYRWRGGDLALLQNVVEEQIGEGRTDKHALLENWRSAENIVEFNNALFTGAAGRVSLATVSALPTEVFADISQKPVKHKGKGFVRIEFLEKWNSRDEDNGADEALNKIPLMLETMQAKGIALKDITILVRRNGEGQKIADFLLKYKSGELAKPGVSYEVVSNESLRIDAASSVQLLVNALRYLSNPDDAVARGELIYEYMDQEKPQSPVENAAHFNLAGRNALADMLPEEFVRHTPSLLKLPLFELTETLIRIFKIGRNVDELAYLQSFQDMALEFGAKDKNDIASFLEWWEIQKGKKSIQVAANTNAATIYTIHKSKGLQFKYVIIPFCSWAMDHEIPPLLWARTEEPPFRDLGFVAVRYDKRLKDSYFVSDYEAEFTRAYLDNLNLLYVAFTRAEEGMYVLAPAPSSSRTAKENKISSVGQLILDVIMGSEALKKDFDEEASVFSRGAIEPLNTKQPRDEYLSVALAHYPAVDWRKKLVIRREATEFFQEPSKKRKKINYGILIHQILSKVCYKADVDDVLTRMSFEGILLKEEEPLMRAKINAIMEHPVSGGWFSKEWIVKTETPVIIPGQQPARIDRVIFKDVVMKDQSHKKKAVIIDYKTGEKKAVDRKQVEEYAGILSRMGYVDVEAYLLYIDTLEAVKVVDKMNYSLF